MSLGGVKSHIKVFNLHLLSTLLTEWPFKDHDCNHYTRYTITVLRTLYSTINIPYSKKFSLVQNFADLPCRPSEEIFVVLNFVPALDLVLANARDNIFHGSYSRSS